MHVVERDTMIHHIFLIKLKQGRMCVYWRRVGSVRVGKAWKERKRERVRTRGAGEGLKLALLEGWVIPRAEEMISLKLANSQGCQVQLACADLPL